MADIVGDNNIEDDGCPRPSTVIAVASTCCFGGAIALAVESAPCWTYALTFGCSIFGFRVMNIFEEDGQIVRRREPEPRQEITEVPVEDGDVFILESGSETKLAVRVGSRLHQILHPGEYLNEPEEMQR